MALEQSKPQPLMIGGRYHFTLTDDSPLELTVRRPLITETDYADARAMALEGQGLTEAELDDKSAAEHFAGAGVHSVAEFDTWISDSLEHLADEAVATQVQVSALEALSDRLREAVPTELVAARASELIAAYQADIEQQGGTLEAVIAASGGTRDDLEAMAHQDAEVLLQHEFALSAFAAKRKLTVKPDELPELMHLPAEVVSQFVEQAKQDGSYDDLLNEAKITKAIQTVMLEAKVTVQEETPEEAEARLEREHAMAEAAATQRRRQARGDAQDGTDFAPDSGAADKNGGSSRPDFKLV